MRHAALFNGIGGFQLAAQLVGWENTMSCEIDKFCNKVTKYHFPNCIQHEDIRNTDFTIYRGFIDILTGGFPCQPYSQAGKRLGKEDDRHLWPEMLRSIGEIQPRWVVGENVRGLTNWNGGLVFDEVQSDLESKGYEVTPFLLPACAVGAPHRRDRVWFVAYSKGQGLSQRSGIDGREEYGEERNDIRDNSCSTGKEWPIADSNHDGSHGTKNRQGYRERNGGNPSRKDSTEQPERCSGEATGEIVTDSSSEGRQGMHLPRKSGRSEFADWACNANTRNWRYFPTQPPVCNGDDGLSARLDGITFSKWRNESIKAGGNAVVPQVALQIFKAIEQYENAHPS